MKESCMLLQVNKKTYSAQKPKISLVFVCTKTMQKLKRYSFLVLTY